MSVDQTEKPKRRFLSPEKKYQIFLEAQTTKGPVGEILRREGIYSTDLARIRQKVKEGVLERLADRPGVKRKTVSKKERIYKGETFFNRSPACPDYSWAFLRVCTQTR